MWQRSVCHRMHFQVYNGPKQARREGVSEGYAPGPKTWNKCFTKTAYLKESSKFYIVIFLQSAFCPLISQSDQSKLMFSMLTLITNIHSQMFLKTVLQCYSEATHNGSLFNATTSIKTTERTTTQPEHEELPVKGESENERHYSLTIFFILVVIGR